MKSTCLQMKICMTQIEIFKVEVMFNVFVTLCLVIFADLLGHCLTLSEVIVSGDQIKHAVTLNEMKSLWV